MGLYVFKLPDVGEGTAEAEIVAWRVAVGDVIDEDAPLVDVMTDKATVEITSPVTGRVLALHGAEGDQATVGAPLVELDVQAEETEEIVEAVQTVRRTQVDATPPPPPSAVPLPQRGRIKPGGSSPSGGSPREAREGGQAPRPLAAPAVRARAKALGVELSDLAGSGPGGRVTHADLDALAARSASRPAPAPAPAPSPAGPVMERREAIHEVKVMGLRRRIAERMQEAKQRIPHFGYVEEVDVTELEELRVHLNGLYGGTRGKLTLLPFLMRAVVRAAAVFPQINARFDDEAGIVEQFEPVHIGIATQTSSGLMVPVVRHAEALDLWDCARAVVRLAAAARGGSASREELSGSTITITSLGPLGGVSHYPVINQPEVAILGPNKIIERPVVRDGQVVVRRMMNLSSSFDHRVVDGQEAAEFIQMIKGLLERPATIFVG